MAAAAMASMLSTQEIVERAAVTAAMAAWAVTAVERPALAERVEMLARLATADPVPMALSQTRMVAMAAVVVIRE